MVPVDQQTDFMLMEMLMKAMVMSTDVRNI